MIFEPNFMMICASMVLGIIVTMRLSYVMGQRWGLDYKRDRYNGANGMGYLGMLQAASVAATAIICGMGTDAALTFGGWRLGLLTDVLTIPFVGLVWIFIIGANRATTRMLAGLLVKVDEVAK